MTSDILIRGGRVFDGGGGPPVDADIAIQGDRIIAGGREVSPRGMRVEPHPELRVGDELELALHLGVRADPLGVAARVDRDDGADGLVLAFDALAPADREELERLLSLLPVVEMPESGEELRGLVVSEIRGRGAAAA